MRRQRPAASRAPGTARARESRPACAASGAQREVATRRLSSTVSSGSSRRPSGTTATPAWRMRSGRRPVRSRSSSVHRAAGGAQHSADREHEARLAGAVGPQQRRHLARRDVQRNTVHDRRARRARRSGLEAQHGRRPPRKAVDGRAHRLRAQVGLARLARRAAPRRSGPAAISLPKSSTAVVLAAGGDQAHVVVDEDHQRARVLGDARITRPRCSVSSSGRPAAGSSSSTTRGRPTTARAISTSRRSRAPRVATLRRGVDLQADERQRVSTSVARASPRAALARVLVRQRDVVGDRELLDRLLGLERAPQAPARAPVVRPWRSRSSPNACTLPLGGPHEAAQHVEERGLAGAVGPDQPARARVEGDRHAVEWRDAAEAHGQVGDLDHRALLRAARAPGDESRRAAVPGAPGPWAPAREAARRRQQHLQHADAEEDGQQIRAAAPSR